MARKRMYAVAGCLTLIGIFAMRWNVVIGGQLFPKASSVTRPTRWALVTREGLLMSIVLTILPLFILWVLVKLLPPWPKKGRMDSRGDRCVVAQRAFVAGLEKAVERMDDLHDTVARLTTSLETLERRVYALEHPSQIQEPFPAQAPSSSGTTQAAQALPFAQGDGAFSVVGKAMLGIAGAYLLRAAAESTTFPRAAVVAIAIAYAVMWLVAATRVRAEAWFASITYAGTSVLILVPMLWELTMRFRFLPTGVTAGILGGFVAAAFALAWKRHFAEVVWVTTAATSIAALAMSITAHDLAPFIVALLVMAIVSEYAAAVNHGLSVRPLVAASADIAVWAMIYICSRPESTRLEYSEVSGALLLTFGPILSGTS